MFAVCSAGMNESMEAWRSWAIACGGTAPLAANRSATSLVPPIDSVAASKAALGRPRPSSKGVMLLL